MQTDMSMYKYSTELRQRRHCYPNRGHVVNTTCVGSRPMASQVWAGMLLPKQDSKAFLLADNTHISVKTMLGDPHLVSILGLGI